MESVDRLLAGQEMSVFSAVSGPTVPTLPPLEWVPSPLSSGRLPGL
jgi:hypothetical protein